MLQAAGSLTLSPGRFRRLGWLVRWLLQSAVAFVLLGLVFWRANLWELSDTYHDFDGWPIVGAVFLNLPIMVIMTVRGQLILRRLDHPVSFLALLPVSTLGNVAGSLTPAAAGELLRAPFFKERYDIPYADGLAAVIYERGLSMFVLAMSTGVAAAWRTLDVGLAAAVTAAGLAGALATPAAAALALRRLRPALADGDDIEDGGSMLQRMRAGLGRSLNSLLVLLRDVRGAAGIELASVLVFLVMAAQTWLVVQALGLDLSLAEAWTALGVSLLAGIATFLPLGLGTLDATFAALVGTTQDGFNTGATAAVLFRAASTLPLGLAALASYLYLLSARRGRVSVSDE